MAVLMVSLCRVAVSSRWRLMAALERRTAESRLSASGPNNAVGEDPPISNERIAAKQ